MQVLHSTTKRFLKGFWNLRQKLFKEIGGKLRNAYGVELSHVQILRTISHHHVSPTQLAEEMQIPAHGISRALDYLATQNLLKRSLHPDDARKRTLTITPAGTTLLSQSDALIESEMQSILSVLSKKDLDLFLHYLEILNKE
jgi:DNA-binding MarR family transcriptional regulator